MKRVRIFFPKNQDESAAQWLFENEIRVLLSYSESDFFDLKIVCICGVPDEKLAAFQEKFKGQMK